MSGNKPEFDPRIHLLSPEEERQRHQNHDYSAPSTLHGSEWIGQDSITSANQHEDDDEALARRLQEEMDQADHEWSQRADDDMELARRMQNQELRNRSDHDGGGNENGYGGSRSGHRQRNSFQDEDEALALRLMEEENSRNCSMGNTGGGRERMPSHDDDLELARRMQNLEHQGLGRSGTHGPSSDHSRMDRIRQEQEDERIARNLLLSGSTTERHSMSGDSLCGSESLASHQTQQGSSSTHYNSNRSAENTVQTGPIAEATPRSQSDNYHVGQHPSDNMGPPLPVADATPRSQSDNYHAAHPSENLGPPLPTQEPTAGPPTAAVIPAAAVTPAPKEKKKKKLFGILRGRTNEKDKDKDNGAKNTPVPLSIPEPTRTPGPLPNSVSIDRPLPIAASAQMGDAKPKKKAFKNKQSPANSSLCCAVCDKPAPRHLATLGKRYHLECFKCVGCHEAIDPSVPFAFSTDDATGDKHPLHRKCYATLYGVKCAVCQESIPTGQDGRVSYVRHPFFEKEQMCPSHASNPGRRCTGCHRFEPSAGLGFADLGDGDRCVCLSCCRTVVVDSEDAQILWKRVIHFMEKKLQLPLWGTMRETPVLIVGYDALNDQMQDTAHSGSSQIMTRGLCLSEHQSGRRIELHRMKFDKNNRSFMPADPESKGFTFFQVPDGSKVNPDASVTAIMCLSGLPSDLTASVMVHEATHAWIKLHPNYNIAEPIPMQVEEGVCQLMALLFLNDGLDPASTEADESGPSDEKLRQYFKFCIETDENEIYGTGYRLAAKAYASIGIEALLSHIVMYKEFPEV